MRCPPVPDEEALAALRQRWHDLVGVWVKDDERHGDISKKWWQEMSREYGSPIRWYHSLCHLHQMFGEFERHRSLVKRPHVVQLAIFFHDLIYDPRSKTNEEDSAERARAFATETALPEEEGEAVWRYIIATKAHQLPAQEGEEDPDLPLFLDMDMSILGQPTAEYMHYAHKVRREYLHVPRDAYLSGRASVLSSFLQQPRIYLSAPYHEQLEAQARTNVQAEIDLLRAGTIPLEEEGGLLEGQQQGREEDDDTSPCDQATATTSS